MIKSSEWKINEASADLFQIFYILTVGKNHLSDLFIEIKRSLSDKNTTFNIGRLPGVEGTEEIKKIVLTGDNLVTCLDYLQDENLVIFTKGKEHSGGFNIINIRLTSKAINLIEGLKTNKKEAKAKTINIFNIETIEFGRLFNLEVKLGDIKSLFSLS